MLQHVLWFVLLATATLHQVASASHYSTDDRLIVLATSGRWQQVRNVCQRLVFDGVTCPSAIARWSDAVSAARLQQPTVFIHSGVDTNLWHQPVSEELDRQVFGVLSELQALLESARWDDVARMIADPALVVMPGLSSTPVPNPVPFWFPRWPRIRGPLSDHVRNRHVRNRRLLTLLCGRQVHADVTNSGGPQSAELLIPREQPPGGSGSAELPSVAGSEWRRMVRDDDGWRLSVSTAFRQALVEFPEIVAHMDGQGSERTAVEMQRAISTGKVRTVQQLADQYHGTSAAHRGRQWLGDQQMARGNWLAALEQYQQMPLTQKSQVDTNRMARMALAQAMLGEPADWKPNVAVSFGDQEMSADEFQKLVDELSGRGQRLNAPSNAKLSASSASSDSLLQSCRILNLGLDVFRNRDQADRRRPVTEDPFEYRWSAIMSDGLIVMNRCTEIMAVDVSEDSVLWASRLRNVEGPELSAWKHVPMRPVLMGSAVLTRRLMDDSTVVECRWLQTGRIRWIAKPDDLQFVSDPFVWNDQVACLTLGRPGRLEGTLRLTLLDGFSGEITEHVPLVRVRDSWWERRYCERLVTDGRLLAILDGALLTCDRGGRLLWSRTELSLPPAIDPYRTAQLYQPPGVHRGQIFMVQPGVRSVVSLNARTGRKRWEVSLPDIQQVIGVKQGCLVVQTKQDLVGLDIESGEPLWSRAAWRAVVNLERSSSGILCRRVLTQRVNSNNSRHSLVQFARLRVEDGRIIQTGSSDHLNGANPRMDPLVYDRNTLWAIVAKDRKSRQAKLAKINFR